MPAINPRKADNEPKAVDHYIGRFRVIEVLGRGSEGVVYLAIDPKLDRAVAIKTTSLGDHPDPVLADLLVSTAQTASKLSHPNIVPVFEAGMNGGSPYVVFEYIEGSTLAQRLQMNGPMPMSRAVVMMSQILAGVAQIHERSLIHGDIKPANILVGADERARVADFGLLRHERAEEFSESTGTLRYMAPECFAGGTTDCRRDVFALGLVFYEMLTGESVISRGARLPQIIDILNKVATAPSTKNPRIPPEIDVIVLKALEKDPGRRYANAGQMKRDLDRIRVPAGTREGIELNEATVHSTVEFLLRRMAHKSDFPALSSSLAGINKISGEGDDASIKALADTIMRDFALTQKLLRLVNSAAIGAGKVTRVSHAITILGVDQLRAVAAGMLLAGGAGGKRSPEIAAALTDTFVAGLISRNVGRMSGLAAVEELFICGMFSMLGELLTLYYLDEEHTEIGRRMAEDGMRTDAAARTVIGLTYDELGSGVARHWQFPPVILKALSPLPAGELQPANSEQDRLWQCAVYSRELCMLARLPEAAPREAALEAHIERFSPLVKIDPATLNELMTRSLEAAGYYIVAAGFAVSETPLLAGMRALTAPPGNAPVVRVSDLEAAVAELHDTTLAPSADATVIPTAAKPSKGWREKLSGAIKSVF